MIANLRHRFPGAAIEIPEDDLMTINGKPLPVERGDRAFATNRLLTKEEMLAAIIPEIGGFLTEQNEEVQRAARLRMTRTSHPAPKLLERSPEEQLLVKSGMEIARNPDGTPVMVNGMPVLVPAGMGSNPNVHRSLAMLQEKDNKDMMPELRIHRVVGESAMPLLIDTDKTDEELIADGIPVTSIGYGTLKVDGKEEVSGAEVVAEREKLLRGRPDDEDGPTTVGGVRLG